MGAKVVRGVLMDEAKWGSECLERGPGGVRGGPQNLGPPPSGGAGGVFQLGTHIWDPPPRVVLAAFSNLALKFGTPPPSRGAGSVFPAPPLARLLINSKA